MYIILIYMMLMVNKYIAKRAVNAASRIILSRLRFKLRLLTILDLRSFISYYKWK